MYKSVTLVINGRHFVSCHFVYRHKDLTAIHTEKWNKNELDHLLTYLQRIDLE